MMLRRLANRYVCREAMDTPVKNASVGKVEDGQRALKQLSKSLNWQYCVVQ